MIVLGLNFHHDASASLIVDGKIQVAISTERITRVKKDNRITKEVIDYILDGGSITLDDIDYIACPYYMPNDYIKAYQPIDNYDLQFQNNIPEPGKGFPVTDEIFFLFPPLIRGNRKWYGGPVPSTTLNFEIVGYDRIIPGFFVNHHLSHCASAYYTSRFDKSAVFSLDASGVWNDGSSMFAVGYGNKIDIMSSPGCALGTMYEEHTVGMGLGSGLFKAGSVMALAAYGKVLPTAIKYKDEIIKPVWLRGVTEHDPCHLRWQNTALFGRTPFSCLTREESDSQQAMDMAASIQWILEEGLKKYTDDLYDYTKGVSGENLCLSGGTFLNCSANGKIRNHTKFKNIHFYPACGDDGTATGAALYAIHNILDLPRVPMENAELMYAGKLYDYSIIEERSDALEIDYEFLVDAIDKGKVVAWYQGKSEFGPRALGNRSFLADPRNPEMKDHINFNVKKREWYRPFAPVIMYNKVQDYFEDFVYDTHGRKETSPFMLFTCKVKDPEAFPAITHADGTARIQTLEPQDNPKLYLLLTQWQKKTGIPMLLNTSLNLDGEPIVETPIDALNLFERGNVDIAVIGRKMFVK
jgi:carbamoyltransferase